MDNMTELKSVLTIPEVADYLRRSEMTIRRRIYSGEIRSYVECRSHRIKREWLLEYEQSLISKSTKK